MRRYVDLDRSSSPSNFAFPNSTSSAEARRKGDITSMRSPVLSTLDPSVTLPTPEGDGEAGKNHDFASRILDTFSPAVDHTESTDHQNREVVRLMMERERVSGCLPSESSRSSSTTRDLLVERFSSHSTTTTTSQTRKRDFATLIQEHTYLDQDSRHLLSVRCPSYQTPKLPSYHQDPVSSTTTPFTPASSSSSDLLRLLTELAEAREAANSRQLLANQLMAQLGSMQDNSSGLSPSLQATIVCNEQGFPSQTLESTIANSEQSYQTLDVLGALLAQLTNSAPAPSSSASISQPNAGQLATRSSQVSDGNCAFSPQNGMYEAQKSSPNNGRSSDVASSDTSYRAHMSCESDDQDSSDELCTSADQDDRINGPAMTMREKTVLKRRRENPGDVLPTGWIEVCHESGIPAYLHKESRVVTLSRPYFLGPGSIRRHDVPVSAILCLHQRLLAEAEKQRAKGGPDATMVPNLTSAQLHDYCAKAIEFETIKVRRFKNWSDQRNFKRGQKPVEQRPSLPSNVKLIPLRPAKTTRPGTQCQHYINPAGKSSINVLHELCQRMYHCQPIYEYSEMKEAFKPFTCTAKTRIDGKLETFATGYGISKRAAKLEAAKLTLATLLPDLKFDEDSAIVEKPDVKETLALFDTIAVTDKQVFEWSVKAGQPTPYQILLEWQKRFGGNMKVEHEHRLVKHNTVEYSLSVANPPLALNVCITCQNKREGKQMASQAMLAKLHPQIQTWGDILRLYGCGGDSKDAQVLELLGDGSYQ